MLIVLRAIGIGGGLSVGRNPGTPVSGRDHPPFAFTGKIIKVTADVSGKTIQDVGKWAGSMKGPPPAKPIGGIPAFMPGKNTYFEVNLPPADYGLICFVPDAKDGKPHVAHGMSQQFKIS